MVVADVEDNAAVRDLSARRRFLLTEVALKDDSPERTCDAQVHVELEDDPHTDVQRGKQIPRRIWRKLKFQGRRRRRATELWAAQNAA